MAGEDIRMRNLHLTLLQQEIEMDHSEENGDERDILCKQMVHHEARQLTKIATELVTLLALWLRPLDTVEDSDEHLYQSSTRHQPFHHGVSNTRAVRRHAVIHNIADKHFTLDKQMSVSAHQNKEKRNSPLQRK